MEAARRQSIGLARLNSQLKTSSFINQQINKFHSMSVDISQNEMTPIYDTIDKLKLQKELKEAVLKEPVVRQPTFKTAEYTLPINREDYILQLRQVKLAPPPPPPAQRKHPPSSSSILHFLCSTKTLRTKSSIPRKVESLPHKKESHKDSRPESRQFTPMGLVRNAAQSSIRSETHSAMSSSRQGSSSYNSSRLVGIHNEEKKYLRKGSHVRQLLARQLQTPQSRSSSRELTYMKEYDQWVPAAIVQQRKKQLEQFMNILYGDKRVRSIDAVDIEKIGLIYL